MPENNTANDRGLLAVDVGNSRVKLGWFPAAGDCASANSGDDGRLAIARPALAPPAATTAVVHRDRPRSEWLSDVQRWCNDVIDQRLWRGAMATVHPQAADALESVMGRGGNRLRRIVGEDLPLKVKVDNPNRVGVDRLLNALAAQALVQPGEAAVLVDMGTAITVDLLDESGAFAGGAILPGANLAAAALHAGTAALPDTSAIECDEPPPAIGKSTEQAIVSGLYWGAVGATRELSRQFVQACPAVSQVVLTGGAACGMEQLLTDDAYAVRYVPTLTLCGLLLAAEAFDE